MVFEKLNKKINQIIIIVHGLGRSSEHLTLESLFFFAKLNVTVSCVFTPLTSISLSIKYYWNLIKTKTYLVFYRYHWYMIVAIVFICRNLFYDATLAMSTAKKKRNYILRVKFMSFGSLYPNVMSSRMRISSTDHSNECILA